MYMTHFDPWGIFQPLRAPHTRVENCGTECADDVVTNWSPAVDIRDEDTQFVLQADVPGVDPADIEITAEEGVLSIKGTRELKRDEPEYDRTERVAGQFLRRFRLPDTVNTDTIAASAKNGVLEVVLPKTEKATAKRIVIKQ